MGEPRVTIGDGYLTGFATRAEVLASLMPPVPVSARERYPPRLVIAAVTTVAPVAAVPACAGAAHGVAAVGLVPRAVVRLGIAAALGAAAAALAGVAVVLG